METEKRFLWLDMEMTGLDSYTDSILELAVVITDMNLNPLDEGMNLVIHHPSEVLNTMDEWNQTTHHSTGLIDRVLKSKWSLQAAEEHLLQYTKKFFPEKTAPICGNTIWQDRMFLLRYMPKLNGYMHYRNIDVSSLKELVLCWYPKIPPFQKKQTHTALSDIFESIAELKYYREFFFRTNNELP